MFRRKGRYGLGIFQDNSHCVTPSSLLTYSSNACRLHSFHYKGYNLIEFNVQEIAAPRNCSFQTLSDRKKGSSTSVSKVATMTTTGKTTYEELERSGDEKFVARDYATAIDSYTRALQMKPDNPILLSKRSQAYINLKQYQLGLRDAEASLKLLDGERRKAMYRWAKALYGLSLYEEALDVVEKLQLLPASPHLPPTDKDIREFAQRLKRRLDEKQSGKYDIISMLKEAEAATVPYLDHAEYVGPVQVAEVKGKGKGMLATKKIAAGTLLLCSKAYAVVFDEECKRKRSISSGDHLVRKIVEKLETEPGTAKELYNLYAGPDMPSLNLQPDTTEKLAVDVDRIGHIVRQNSFETAIKLWSSLSAQSQHEQESDVTGSGLWILPAFINHSCLANARYNSIGDFMFVRAINDIAEGEEICLSYIDPLDTFEHRTLRLLWRRFDCQCSLCIFAREQPEVTSTRIKLLNQFEQIRPWIKMGDSSMLPLLITILASLRKTFKTVSSSPSATAPPPLELFRPLLALSHLHTVVGQFDRALNALLESFDALPRLGGNTSTSIARTDIAWRLRSMYKMLGKKNEMKKWGKKAKEEFKITFGETEKLWQNYVDDYDAAHS